jgi:hypothetical protein
MIQAVGGPRSVPERMAVSAMKRPGLAGTWRLFPADGESPEDPAQVREQIGGSIEEAPRGHEGVRAKEVEGGGGDIPVVGQAQHVQEFVGTRSVAER